jgi:hypothetical protein
MVKAVDDVLRLNKALGNELLRVACAAAKHQELVSWFGRRYETRKLGRAWRGRL